VGPRTARRDLVTRASRRGAPRPLPDSPLTVAYGCGVDSTAMLIGFLRLGIRPDLILMADTGAEKRGTLRYLEEVARPWLARVGFPDALVVRYVPKRAPYSTLEGECAKNETLPSLAFGMKTCSLKWKKEPQDTFKKTWPDAIAAWARGAPIVTAVGLDNGTKDTARACKYWANPVEPEINERIWYPLREWEWDRERCSDVILSEGLPLPPKSSCFMCPAMHESEIAELAEVEPDLFLRAIRMEDRARLGKNKIGSRSTKGLGRRWAWRDRMAARGVPLPPFPKETAT
jgi:hypothetical protein